MNTVIIAIGSNINAHENIKQMLQILAEEVEIVQLSSLIQTSPIGITDQEDFTNGAVKIRTDMTAGELRKFLKKLEDKMGRDRSLPKFGPRIIDLDILVFNDELMDEDYFSRDFLRSSAQELGYIHNRT